MSTMKPLIDPKSNVALASACVPDGYLTGGQLTMQAQSDIIPFTFSTHAVGGPNGILMLGFSEELYSDIRSGMIKAALKMANTQVPTSFRNYTEPGRDARQLAESVFQAPLQEIAVTELPTAAGANVYADRIAGLAQEYAAMETNGGTQCNVVNTILQPLLFRYSGTGPKDGKPYTVLSGVIFEGFEVSYPTAAMLNPLGALFGAGEKVNKPSGTGFGYEKCDICRWGSFARFLMIAPDEHRDEAIRAFGEYITTWNVSPDLLNQADRMRAQYYQNNLQQVAVNQAQTRVNIANNMYNQQKLTNMLAQNSQEISAGLMDSWNQKMASDSRISANFSEATRGVNTYVGTDGKPVEVSVTADHVYQNAYGNTIGVSGNAVDPDILNRLNWTEIGKK